MLPGEEYAIERWHRSFSAWLRGATMLPASDGASWWIDPAVVNTILLAILTILLLLRFGHEAKSAPRRIMRRIRDRRHLARNMSLRDRVRFRRRPIADFAKARSLLEERLSSMVGLADIKEHFVSLLDKLEMDHRRQSMLPTFMAQRGCMHMTFIGNPGTGKTAVAQLMAVALREMGMLRRGHLVVARKDDLLGRYSNHVAHNTRLVIESAIGGVLFLDEAYSLLQGEVELGREALNILVDMAYKHKDDLVIVLAGYTDAMSDLFSSNAGLASRFPHKFRFSDYDLEELVKIGMRMLGTAGFRLADGDAEQALGRMLAPIVNEVPCGNARSVENRIELALVMQSKRLRSELALEHPSLGAATQSLLFELTAADLNAAGAVADRAGSVLIQQHVQQGGGAPPE